VQQVDLRLDKFRAAHYALRKTQGYYFGPKAAQPLSFLYPARTGECGGEHDEYRAWRVSLMSST
jgi:hypothetical protein